MDQITRNKSEMFQTYKSARLLVKQSPDDLAEILEGMSKTAMSFDDLFDTLKAIGVSEIDTKLSSNVSSRLAKKIQNMKESKANYAGWHNMLDQLDLKNSEAFSDVKDAIFNKMLVTATRAQLYALVFELNQTGMCNYVPKRWFELLEERILLH